jgi:hypothetical protein
MSGKTPLEMLIGDEAQLRRRLGELEQNFSLHQRNTLQTQGELHRRVGQLERKLTAEIALVKAMCNAVDWDTAEAKGVGVALSPSAKTRPIDPEQGEGENPVQDDFPCCTQGDTVEPAYNGKMIFTRAELKAAFDRAEQRRVLWLGHHSPGAARFYAQAYGEAKSLADLLNIDY